jgi:pectate lyase
MAGSTGVAGSGGATAGKTGGTGTAGSTASGGTSTAGSTASGGTSTAGSTASGGTGTAGSTTGGGTGTAGAQSSSELIGWATLGTGGTKGGGELTPVVATSLAQLNTEAGGDTAKVIHVQGKISGMVTVGSNKTIIGLTGAEISDPAGTLRLTDSKNVIIKNFKLTGGDGGVNVILHNAKNVWFDHNAVTDGKSELLRLTGTSDFVTISWNVFDQTKFAHEHMGVNIGLKDTDVEGKGFLNVTLHHNLYLDHINERMPRARFGKVHTFNNVCNAGTTTDRAYYAVRAGVDANVRSERNIYKDFNGPQWWWKEGWGSPNATVFNYARTNENSVLESIEDVCLPDCEKGPIPVKETDGFTGEAGFYSKGKAFMPTYPYTAEPTLGLEAKVIAGAGPK